MAQKPAELDPQELARFAARLSEHMKELEASVDQWREYRDDYQQLGDLLANLPDKTSYDIMVSINKSMINLHLHYFNVFFKLSINQRCL
jgi:hypothetical protein